MDVDNVTLAAYLRPGLLSEQISPYNCKRKFYCPHQMSSRFMLFFAYSLVTFHDCTAQKIFIPHSSNSELITVKIGPFQILLWKMSCSICHSIYSKILKLNINILRLEWNSVFSLSFYSNLLTA